MGYPMFPPRSKIRQTPDAPGGQSEAADNSTSQSKDDEMENSDKSSGATSLSEDQGNDPGQSDQDDRSPEDLANDVGQDLQKLNELFSSSDQIKPEEKAALAQIIQAYTDLYKSLSGDSGEDQGSQQMPADQGMVPMEAGNQKVQPVM